MEILVLILPSVYILGIRQQAGVDHTRGWCGTRPIGGNFRSARPARTDGMSRSRDGVGFDH